MLKFANPAYLFLLLLIIPMVAWYVLRQLRGGEPTLKVSDTRSFVQFPKTYRNYLRHLPFLLRLLAVACVIIVLARPQRTDRFHNESIEGINIMMTMDISSSMLAEDLRPNRLEASKNVAAEFVNGRPNDAIGLVVFSSESFTQCPMTSDHTALINLMQSVRSGIIEDGTAIGLGLANAINRIKDCEGKSKVIILLTDGSNNCGDIAPITAAEIAKQFGIRIYTIGIGTTGEAPYPVQTSFGIRYQNIPVDIDETTLRTIAETTGGQYFRATDNKKLKAIYEEIDKMEKIKINVNEYSQKTEEYLPYAVLAFLLIIAELLLRNTILKRIP
ncbi:MAG: VWA domain-containing protein [Paludibacteraceae bacterium]|nr:VWA domain-containing protein [Paludibacteraceae bacterium]